MKLYHSPGQGNISLKLPNKNKLCLIQFLFNQIFQRMILWRLITLQSVSSKLSISDTKVDFFLTYEKR